MAKDVIWTAEASNLLYSELVNNFGPYSKWFSKVCPDKARRDDYQALLTEIASAVGSSPTGVQCQINWALATQPEVRDSLVRQFIINKAAALLAGFIDSTMLPQQMGGMSYGRQSRTPNVTASAGSTHLNAAEVAQITGIDAGEIGAKIVFEGFPRSVGGRWVRAEVEAWLADGDEEEIAA